jgi:hypothetical protein
LTESVLRVNERKTSKLEIRFGGEETMICKDRFGDDLLTFYVFLREEDGVGSRMMVVAELSVSSLRISFCPVLNFP